MMNSSPFFSAFIYCFLNQTIHLYHKNILFYLRGEIKKGPVIFKGIYSRGKNYTKNVF